MAPAVRKSRSVNKRFTNEPSPRKDAGSSRKSKQRVSVFCLHFLNVDRLVSCYSDVLLTLLIVEDEIF